MSPSHGARRLALITARGHAQLVTLLQRADAQRIGLWALGVGVAGVDRPSARAAERVRPFGAAVRRFP